MTTFAAKCARHDHFCYKKSPAIITFAAKRVRQGRKFPYFAGRLAKNEHAAKLFRVAGNKNPADKSRKTAGKVPAFRQKETQCSAAGAGKAKGNTHRNKGAIFAARPGKVRFGKGGFFVLVSPFWGGEEGISYRGGVFALFQG